LHLPSRLLYTEANSRHRTFDNRRIPHSLSQHFKRLRTYTFNTFKTQRITSLDLFCQVRFDMAQRRQRRIPLLESMYESSRFIAFLILALSSGEPDNTIAVTDHLGRTSALMRLHLQDLLSWHFRVLLIGLLLSMAFPAFERLHPTHLRIWTIAVVALSLLAGEPDFIFRTLKYEPAY